MMLIGFGLPSQCSAFVLRPRGVSQLGGGYMSSSQLLSTDSVGTANVTFKGVNANCEIRVYDSSLNEVAGVENCSADHTLSWPAFQEGSPSNNVRIVIMATGYRLREIQYSTVVGNSILPIQQEVDKWYSNP